MSTTGRTPLPLLDECPCSGRNLDRFIQPAVLAILSRGPVHGYRIVQDLGRMPTFSGHRPDATGVYRFLKAMEDRRLVSSAWDLSESGPAKRLFDLTAQGTVCLERWAVTLEQYREQIGELIQSLRQPVGRAAAKPCGCGHAKPRKGTAGKRRGGKTVSR
ncbi:MAG: helix-turn-helix transcriptional regulator [Planctomycetota bacterium]|nr:helix-turn-helix transcriptional regulator [Planctomycetota bacterium]